MSEMEELLRGVADQCGEGGRPFLHAENFRDRVERVLRESGLLRLLEAGHKARTENQKFVDWLERMAKHSEEHAVSCNFISLREAYATDAKNFRAMGKNKRELIAEWDAAKATMRGA